MSSLPPLPPVVVPPEVYTHALLFYAAIYRYILRRLRYKAGVPVKLAATREDVCLEFQSRGEVPPEITGQALDMLVGAGYLWCAEGRYGPAKYDPYKEKGSLEAVHWKKRRAGDENWTKHPRWIEAAA